MTITEPACDWVSTFWTSYDPLAPPIENSPSTSTLAEAFAWKSLSTWLWSPPVKVSFMVGCWLMTKVFSREKAPAGPKSSLKSNSDPWSW